MASERWGAAIAPIEIKRSQGLDFVRLAVAFNEEIGAVALGQASLPTPTPLPMLECP
jgi:hypothetical protein